MDSPDTGNTKGTQDQLLRADWSDRSIVRFVRWQANAIGNSMGNSIGNSIGNPIGNSIGNPIGNSIGNSTGNTIGNKKYV